MIKKLSNNLVDKLSLNSDYDMVDKEKMAYALEGLMTDGSKTLLLFIAFAMFGQGLFFLTTWSVTVLLRNNLGGFHFKGYFTCFAFSSLYFLGMLLLFLASPGNGVVILTLVEICIVVQLFIAPVTTPMKDTVRNIDRSVAKIKSAVFSVVIAVLFIIINNPYTSIAMWVVIIQTLFILLYKGVRIYEKKTNNHS